MLSLKDIGKYWDDFFFKPRPVDSIALFRILWSSILLMALLLDWSNINDFYGPHAIVSLKTIKNQFPYNHLNLFHLFNSSYDFVYLLISVYAVALLFSLFGLYTRTAMLVVFVCMTSFHQRNLWLLSSSELLMRLVTLYMVFSPCGNAYSIDSLLGRKYIAFKKEKESAPWALRMIQIQVSVVYLWTVWHKLNGNSWIDGTAVYYATRIQDLKNFSIPLLLDWVPFLKIATWGTLVVELALAILVWIKEFRRPVIIIGIIFHLGIELMMSIPFFEVIMISLLLLYVTPEEVRSFVESKKLLWLERLNQSKMAESYKQKIIWIVKG